MIIIKKIFWWILEIVIWYLFFYVGIYAVENSMDVGKAAFLLVLLASFGVYANPVTRHLSFWNKMADEVIKKEEEKGNF